MTIEMTRPVGELSAGTLPHVTRSVPNTLPAKLGTPTGRHLVALDIDGTTVQHDGTLRDPVLHAVNETVENGHDVVIATGRSMIAAKPVIDALGLRRGFAVFSNGAVTVRLDPDLPGGMEVIDQQTFHPREVLNTLRAYFPGGALAVERVGVGFDVNRRFPEGELDGDVRVVPWRRLTRWPTTRVTFCDPDTDVEVFAEHVGAMGLHGVNYAVGFTAWLDITALGVSKASALESVRALVDAPIERTVAVGDQRNDIEMLAWAGCGVAMGNAPVEVASVADFVTGHVDDDGLADVLRALPGV
ncbi:MAG: HAD family hydrolase [Dermatophilus congolensis]|nr:HAD family hydrolase [Dermatophilus congolensis]